MCFLPTIINQLFRLLVSINNEDVALNIVRVLIHVVTTVFEAGKNHTPSPSIATMKAQDLSISNLITRDLPSLGYVSQVIQLTIFAGKVEALHSYVQYAFTIDSETTKTTVQTVHQELCLALCKLFAQSEQDFLVVNKFLLHSWFFLQIITKSMALYLLRTERIKVNFDSSLRILSRNLTSECQLFGV